MSSGFIFLQDSCVCTHYVSEFLRIRIVSYSITLDFCLVFCLFCFILVCFYFSLFWFIIILQMPVWGFFVCLFVLFFVNKRQNAVDSDVIGSRVDLGGVGEGENVIKVLYEQKKSIFSKRKKKKVESILCEPRRSSCELLFKYKRQTNNKKNHSIHSS